MQLSLKNAYRLPVLSGILIGTSYIPFPPWASLFCFIPLWLFWEQQTKLTPIILGGLISSFIFTLIGFNWVTYLLHEFAHLSWWLAGLGMCLFALFAHLFVTVAGGVWFVGKRRGFYTGWQSSLVLALLTALALWLIPMLFKWNFGYAWYGTAVPLYHLAEYIGFSGLSMLTIIANAPLLYAWKNRQEKKGKIILIRVGMVFLLLNVLGLSTKAFLPAPDAVFHPLLVQANIGNAEKMAAEFGEGFYTKIIHQYESVTDKGLQENAGKPIDFILWSETAFPSLLNKPYQSHYFAQQLQQYINQGKVPLITGAYGKDSQTGLITNSLFVLNKQGEVHPSYYSKTILLAFGEYLPGEQWFPVIRQFLPIVGNFGRGHGPTTLLTLKDYKMGPQICYESLFPDFSIALADLGAQFIINVTNDSWYGQWQEPYQHLTMTLARAIEIRRPLVRVTNTGISTVVLASGKVLTQSPMHKAWAGYYTVPYLKHPKATFYQKNTDLLPIILFVILLGIFLNGLKIRLLK